MIFSGLDGVFVSNSNYITIGDVANSAFPPNCTAAFPVGSWWLHTNLQPPSATSLIGVAQGITGYPAVIHGQNITNASLSGTNIVEVRPGLPAFNSSAFSGSVNGTIAAFGFSPFEGTRDVGWSLIPPFVPTLGGSTPYVATESCNGSTVALTNWTLAQLEQWENPPAPLSGVLWGNSTVADILSRGQMIITNVPGATAEIRGIVNPLGLAVTYSVDAALSGWSLSVDFRASGSGTWTMIGVISAVINDTLPSFNVQTLGWTPIPGTYDLRFTYNGTQGNYYQYVYIDDVIVLK